MAMLVPKTLRIVLALGAFFVVAIAVAACGGSGNSVPSNAVASVDGTAITKADYQHWYAINAKSSAQQGSAAVVPDPPAYTSCIAAVEQAAAKAKSKTKVTDAQAKSQCDQLNTQITNATMGRLIQYQWLTKEAKSLGVTVSQKDVDTQLAQTKKTAFPTAKAWNNFLKQSGMTMDDVDVLLRTNLYVSKIGQKVQSQSSPVTDAQVSSYYTKNKAQFAVPERRDLEIILTKQQATANEAKSAVQGGMSWADAAKKYSIDTVSRGNGGVLKGVAKGQQDQALDVAAFNAQKGTMVGPVKGQFGYYLVRVTAVTTGKQQTLDEVKGQIKQQLTQQHQNSKVQSFSTDFQKRWTSKTECRKGYVIPICKNAPKPKTTSTAGGTVATTPSTTSTSGK